MKLQPSHEKFVIAAAALIAVLSVFIVAGILISNKQGRLGEQAAVLQQPKPEEVVRAFANAFVAQYGSYSTANYDQYVSNMKYPLTENYYQQDFSEGVVANKKASLSGITSVATVPTSDSIADVEVTIDSDSSATAKVFAIESTLDANGKQTDKAVDYTIRYLLVNDRWKVDDVKIYREETDPEVSQ